MSLRTLLFSGVILTCLSALAPSPAARASIVELLDLDTLVKEADQVVLARVIREWSHYDEGGRIVTDFQMQVERAEKGDAVPGAAIIVRKLGGVIDGIGMRVEGEPSFQQGELVLVFGVRGQRTFLRPVGMGQGAVRIFEENGELWARSTAQGMALLARSGNKSKALAVPQPRKLDELLREVEALVSKQH
jgi:hypothetical protein